jgi:hypothetical protein
MTQGIRPPGAASGSGETAAPDALKNSSPAGARPGDVTGAAAKAPKTVLARPELPAPSLTPAAMMIALQKLNMAMADQAMRLGDTSLKTMEKEIRDSAAERAKELKKYFENQDKVNDKKKCGLLGLFVKFFKRLFTGDWAGLRELGQTIKDNWLTMLKDVLAAVVAIVALVATPVLGPVAVIGAGLLLAGMVLTDPGIGEMIMDALPEDKRKGAMIALAVVGGVCALAGGIMMGCATGGASLLVTVSTVISTVIQAGATAYEGAEGYEQAGYKADAAKGQARIDRADANTAELQGALGRKQSELKDLFESLGNMLHSTQDMITTYGRLQATAAKV